jgi:hypothetical protein
LLEESVAFFYPDFTVDSGISPDLRLAALVGFDHRSGISPCPEGMFLTLVYSK